LTHVENPRPLENSHPTVELRPSPQPRPQPRLQPRPTAIIESFVREVGDKVELDPIDTVKL